MGKTGGEEAREEPGVRSRGRGELSWGRGCGDTGEDTRQKENARGVVYRDDR